VICNSKKCLIVASKEEAYFPQIDPYSRLSLFPQNDYLLFILKDITKNEYCGMLDVLEAQIDKGNW